MTNRVAALIVCGGNSARMRLPYSKLLFSPFLNDVKQLSDGNYRVISTTVVYETLKKFAPVPSISQIVLIIRREDEAYYNAIAKLFFAEYGKEIQLVYGGEDRTESVRAGLAAIATEVTYIAVHDGARPYVKSALIEELIDTAAHTGNCCPAHRIKDTLRYEDNPLRRERAMTVSTPQVFERELLLKAYAACDEGEGFTDDAGLVEALGGAEICYLISDDNNEKITYREDLDTYRRYVLTEGFVSAKALCGASCEQCGIGYDVHRLSVGRKLFLGGVEIPCAEGLLGHSDADVVLHALMNSLLSSVGLYDIGHYFPDTEEEFRGANSAKLLARVLVMLREKGASPKNVAISIIAQRPRLYPYVDEIKSSIAGLLGVSEHCVGVTATSSEGLGIVQNGAIVALCSATVTLR